jgi:hypothetical protein
MATMTVEERELSKQIAAQIKMSPGMACAWCNHTIVVGRRGALVHESDWHKYASHGMCAECTKDMKLQVHIGYANRHFADLLKVNFHTDILRWS